jgi:hypothetical protein
MGAATGLLGGQLTNRSSIPGKGQRFVCSAVSISVVGPTLLLVRGYWGGCRVMKLTTYLYLVPMVRNEWICTSIPPYTRSWYAREQLHFSLNLKQDRIGLFPK